MTHESHPDLIGGRPPDEVDCFGAHVGMPLGYLHRLRAVRERLQWETGRSWTLTEALCFCVRTIDQMQEHVLAGFAPAMRAAERDRFVSEDGSPAEG